MSLFGISGNNVINEMVIYVIRVLTTEISGLPAYNNYCVSINVGLSSTSLKVKYNSVNRKCCFVKCLCNFFFQYRPHHVLNFCCCLSQCQGQF